MRYLILILLCALSADAQMLRVKRRAASVSYPGFTADVSQTFESALSGVWSESDASSLITPQSTTQKYRGTYAMAAASGSAADGFVKATPSSSKNSMSIGFWYRTGTYDNWAGWKSIVYFINDANGNVLIVREGKSAGDNSRQLLFSLAASGVTVSDNTWYWITVKCVRNGTSSLAVYNTSGTQVGSTVTGSTSDWAIDYLYFGTSGTASNSATYFDEIYIDYTSSTFPLGPPSGT